MISVVAQRMLSVNGLSVSYYAKEALHSISFCVEEGKLIGIVGPNGAGKSTLVKAILGLIRPSSGGATFGGVPLSSRAVAYVKQRSDNDLTFPIRVIDVVIMGSFASLRLFRRPSKAHRKQALEALREVDMLDFAKAQIGELSGGQLQRVFLARVLMQDAQIIFLDEPFSGIDIDSEQKIIKILKKLRDDGKTIVMVYHDLSNVTNYFDKVIILNKEVIAFGDTENVFTKENIALAYKSSLIDIFTKGKEEVSDP